MYRKTASSSFKVMPDRAASILDSPGRQWSVALAVSTDDIEEGREPTLDLVACDNKDLCPDNDEFPLAMEEPDTSRVATPSAVPTSEFEPEADVRCFTTAKEP
jgi:hypothetical protein